MTKISERTCIICRKKHTKDELFRIVEKGDKYIFDEKMKSQKRGTYICRSQECVNRLSKHKKIKVEIDDLLKMLSLLKKDTKDYLKVLKAMKNSQELVFGVNMIFDEIEKIHFMIIAEDISEKNDNKLIRKANENNIHYIHYGSKVQLGEIFDKEEVNVIAIKNKRVARGLIG